MNRLLFLLLPASVICEKCYSCSSGQLNLRWPKDKSNKLLYLSTFPHYANESCDQVRNLLPVVDCPGSVCIKAVIKEPPAKREACVQGGAVVRDCWSRIMQNVDEQFSMKPQTKNNVIRLSEHLYSETAVGFIYTCEGFLCNGSSSPSLLSLLSLFASLLLLRQ